jgi:thiamine monophosphate kinase
MQTASDIFLGWQRVKDIDGHRRDYYIRQLHDWKGSAHVESLRVSGALTYARMCGATLARAHARSGDWIAMASYLGKGTVFDEAMADFASSYADQNEEDYEALAAAVRSGRVEAETGL